MATNIQVWDCGCGLLNREPAEKCAHCGAPRPEGTQQWVKVLERFTSSIGQR